MNTVKVQELTHESFAGFGEFYAMDRPEGYALSGELHRFFPDRISVSAQGRIAFSPILVKKPDRMIITQVEFHKTTWEMILPMNDDMILHVSPASGDYPVTSLTQAFLIPKGTLVRINTAEWHLAPLPANVPELTAMIILPECTYGRDCTVIDLKEEDVFEIIR